METKPISELVSKALASVPNQTTPKAFNLRTCCLCGKLPGFPEGDPRWRELDVKCDDCVESERKRRQASIVSQQKALRDEILSQIPTAFRSTIREKLPFPDRMDAALKWQFGPRGLLLYGPTGCGKSRVAWEIARREVLSGRTFKCVNAFELSRYPSLLMMNGGEADSFARELASLDLLMLDDVFKAKPTERVEELLFAVIDERGQWERPCIITLNDTGETLSSRLSPDRGPALIRRLREYCQAIQF